MSKTLNEYVIKLTAGRAKIMEEQIRVVLRDRPKWLPKLAWNWLIGKLIYLERREVADRKDKSK